MNVLEITISNDLSSTPRRRFAGRQNQGQVRLIPSLVLGLLSLGLLSVTACRHEGQELGATAAAAFELETLDGSTLGPGDFPGKIVVVDFWATWCAPCRVQAEILEELHQEFEGEVEFMAVSIGEDRETVRSYVEDSPFPYPVLIDPEDTVSVGLGIIALPTVMIVDGDGSVVYLQSGVSSAPTLRRELSELG